MTMTTGAAAAAAAVAAAMISFKMTLAADLHLAGQFQRSEPTIKNVKFPIFLVST